MVANIIPNAITAVPGVMVGHWTHPVQPTGCTVVLFDDGATGGVDVRGGAPGTRETDLLHPVNLVEQVHAIVLSGGSAYGLATACGVMRFLEERKAGFAVGSGVVVPIVPCAVLMDLHLGDGTIRPDAASGYQACCVASDGPVAEGCVGAGAGASVGKLFGMQGAMKAGLGTAAAAIPGSDAVVGVLVAVNAAGDVLDPASRHILAGARDGDDNRLRGTMARLLAGERPLAAVGGNTTLGLVATNLTLPKPQVTKVAQMAHDGLARAIDPVHTMYDGDTIFAVATGKTASPMDTSVVGAFAATLMARAVVRAVQAAAGLPGCPAWRKVAEQYNGL